MSQTNPVSQVDEDEIDIGQIISALWRGKWLIILLSIITGAMGVTYAIVATPIYESNALLQIEAKSGASGLPNGLNDILSLGGGGAATSTELELLKSRKVIVPTIAKFHLEIIAEPKTFPIIGSYLHRTYIQKMGFRTPLFADYFDFTQAYAWGGEQIIVKQFKVPEYLYETRFDVIALGDAKYSLNLNNNEILIGELGEIYHIDDLNVDIQLDVLTGRIGTHFNLKHLDPILVADKLISDLIVAENGKTSGIVGMSLQGKDKTQIENIISYVLSTYQQQNIEYNSIEASKNLDFMADQLPDAAEQLRIAEEKIYEYRLTNKTVNLDAKSQQILAELLTVERELNKLKLQESDLSRKFKKQHPIYIEFLRKQKELEVKKSEITAQTAQISTEQFETFRLQRDVELAQTLYLQMVNRFESLKIIKAGTSGSIRVIDEAIVHPKAVKPQKVIIVIVATVAGIIFGIGFVLIRPMLVGGINNRRQLDVLGYNIYATIGTSANQKRLSKLKPKRGELRILSELKPDDMVVEALRNLRTNIHFTVAEADNNLIMLVGASPLVGKSFVVQNLAALLAQSGKKILLVDADLRRGKLHDAFGITSDPGLADYLKDDAELKQVCRETRAKNLDIITCGRKSSNPSELLLSENFAKLCKTQQKKYDYIIIDTPPVLAVTDASIIGEYAGTTLMVVRQDVSKLDEVEQAVGKLALTDIIVKGYVFNAANKDKYQYDYS